MCCHHALVVLVTSLFAVEDEETVGGSPEKLARGASAPSSVNASIQVRSMEDAVLKMSTVAGRKKLTFLRQRTNSPRVSSFRLHRVETMLYKEACVSAQVDY